MIFSTKGIVLHRFKYSDAKTIVKIFTSEFGLQSYLIYGASSQKSKQILSLLQPLFLLEMQVYFNEKKELQKIKEISNSFPFKSIPFDIYKSSISLFLAEFIMKILSESNRENKKIFAFMFNAIKFLDNLNENYLNFHIVFLFLMTELLGIAPRNNFSDNKKIFDLTAGKFVIGLPIHKDYINIEESEGLKKLFDIDFFNLQNLKLSNYERRYLLDTLINFYKIHLGEPTNLKSIKVLKEIF